MKISRASPACNEFRANSENSNNQAVLAGRGGLAARAEVRPQVPVLLWAMINTYPSDGCFQQAEPGDPTAVFAILVPVFDSAGYIFEVLAWTDRWWSLRLETVDLEDVLRSMCWWYGERFGLETLWLAQDEAAAA
jgi:hypothetical protein